MNARSTSFARNPHLPSRPSLSSRLSFAVSHAERGESVPGQPPAETLIEEEIAEIKRYEVRPCRPVLDPILFLA
jgi:chloride channel 3/4/5